MIKLALNTHKSNNYAFFCPATRLHLTITNPVGNTDRISGAILRAVRANTVIDVDGVKDDVLEHFGLTEFKDDIIARFDDIKPYGEEKEVKLM